MCKAFDITCENLRGFPDGSVLKNPPANARRHRRHGFNLWVGKIPWRRKLQLTPVFLPAESHGQRSLVGYSPWGHKESDMIEQQSMWGLYNWMWYLAAFKCLHFSHSLQLLDSQFILTPRTPWVAEWITLWFYPTLDASLKPLLLFFLERGQ